MMGGALFGLEKPWIIAISINRTQTCTISRLTLNFVELPRVVLHVLSCDGHTAPSVCHLGEWLGAALGSGIKTVASPSSSQSRMLFKSQITTVIAPEFS